MQVRLYLVRFISWEKIPNIRHYQKHTVVYSAHNFHNFSTVLAGDVYPGPNRHWGGWIDLPELASFPTPIPSTLATTAVSRVAGHTGTVSVCFNDGTLVIIKDLKRYYIPRKTCTSLGTIHRCRCRLCW